MTQKGELARWQEGFKLRARWNDRSLEDMARKAYIFSLLLSLWSQRLMNVCWITDQDQSVANEDRLDDAQRVAARLSTLHVDHPMGEFAMNSTAVDDSERSFEDLCALPDLAAGTVAEICSSLPRRHNAQQPEVLKRPLSPKSEIISSWFWYSEQRLLKTMIRIDPMGTQNLAQKIEMNTLCEECFGKHQASFATAAGQV